LKIDIDPAKESSFSAESERLKKEIATFREELSGVSDKVESLQKKMVTMSTMERKILSVMDRKKKEGQKSRSVEIRGKTFTWHQDDKLGEGAMGSVFKAKSKDGTEVIALKLAEYTGSRDSREHENLMARTCPQC
jgi:predicted nuclease with TOPRIM domain